MLRAFVGYRQDDWDQQLTAAEFACNNAPNASTGMSPFQINGRDPLNPYTTQLAIPDTIPSMAEFLETQVNATKRARDALVLAKASQERYANKSRREVSFQAGNMVLLSAQHIHLASQANRPSKKLQHRFLGPFTVIQQVSKVAYKLDLPESLKVHPVFHVSLLRPYKDPATYPNRPAAKDPPPPVTVDDIPEYEVERILDHRKKRRHQEYLVKWVGYPEHDASWEPEENLANAPEILHKYKASGTMPEGGGSDVMVLQSAEPTEPHSHERSPAEPTEPHLHERSPAEPTEPHSHARSLAEPSEPQLHMMSPT
jgi:hypothetical protein